MSNTAVSANTKYNMNANHHVGRIDLSVDRSDGTWCQPLRNSFTSCQLTRVARLWRNVICHDNSPQSVTQLPQRCCFDTQRICAKRSPDSSLLFRLFDGKCVSYMTYSVSSGMLNLSSINRSLFQFKTEIILTQKWYWYYNLKTS